MALKTAILRNTAWMKKQHDLPCEVCGREGTTVGAHQRLGGEGGMGMKPSDDLTIPLCQVHHDAEHRGWRTFWIDRVLTTYPHVLKNLLLARAREIYREYFADEGEAILLDALRYFERDIHEGGIARNALERFMAIHPKKNLWWRPK